MSSLKITNEHNKKIQDINTSIGQFPNDKIKLQEISNIHGIMEFRPHYNSN